MAGHSHWANIARKKSLIDAKRGKLWSKLAKAIIVAAKHGGADPDANLRLRYAIDAAKAVSNCLECHDLDNSPQFDFDSYWPQVEHGEEEGAAAAAAAALTAPAAGR